MNPASTRHIRCAIYTRKSSEEGLEQDFNSLDAQREACAAYVASQASQGWSLLPQMYDDGGLSGGSLERPALQRLLADVKSGQIDTIVVYKVDRLTRSLLDFAKLVEAFDAADVSFVSITQSFNTTTSMGRLTLNMLLSFAQFEREVTAERIRDKLAASKAKGMWMGGIPPLGYEPDGRSLKIIEEHASLIRDIHARYLQIGNVRILAEELLRESIRVPVRTLTTGRTIGGGAFTRGQIYKILSNPIYRGKIAHKDQTFEGLHDAIIDASTWECVQAKLADNSHKRRTRNERSNALLAGLLFDHDGNPLKAVHTTKPVPGKPECAARRYRYYIEQAEPRGVRSNRPPTLRIPASEIEQLVKKELKRLFEHPLALIERTSLKLPSAVLPVIEAKSRQVALALDGKARRIIRSVIARILIYPDRIELQLSSSGIAKVLDQPLATSDKDTFAHEVRASLKRSGLAVRLIEANGQPATADKVDLSLIRLINQARTWWAELSKGELNIASLARQEGVTRSYIARILRLAFLSPELIDAILNGRATQSLSGHMLRAKGVIADDWTAQRKELLGA